MSAGTSQVDPAVLRVLLRRLDELETEAYGVADTVLGHLPDAGPGIAQATLAEMATGVSDAFTTLAGSIATTRRFAAPPLPQRPVEIDLRDISLDQSLDQAPVVTWR